DDLCSQYLQRFLNDHQVPIPMPLYDIHGRYLFASPGKVEVLTKAFLRAVARGRDNELFVILADLLELGDHLGKIMAAVKVALARHHQVMIVCPWPGGVPLPRTRRQESGVRSQDPSFISHSWLLSFSHPWLLSSEGFSESTTIQALLHRAEVIRFQRAYHHLRRSFARLRVPVLCAKSDDSVPLILNRLERLRILERGMA